MPEYTSREVMFHIAMILLSMATTLVTSEGSVFMYMVPVWIRRK